MFLWPESYPDTSFQTTTPGLLSDKTFSTLNEDLKKVDALKRSQTDGGDMSHIHTGLQTLTNKTHIMYKSIPFAFLTIELPDVR